MPCLHKALFVVCNASERPHLKLELIHTPNQKLTMNLNRKRFYRIAYSIAILSMVSCGSNNTSSSNDTGSSNDTSSVSNINTEENIVQEAVETAQVSDFEIIEITGQFEPSKKLEGAILNVFVKLKNNTSHTINNIEIISAIKAQYKNENNPTYYPDPNYDYESDLKYLNGPTASQYGGMNNYKAKEKWTSGQTKTFNLKVFYYYGLSWAEIGFINSIFERTPNKVEFIAAYKFIGLDGEYEDEIAVNMLDLWKAYQTQIGLR